MNKCGLIIPLLIALFTACGENETPVGTYATADFQKFAVALQGEDVGYMTMETEQRGDSLIIRQSMEWHLLLMGTTRTVTMDVESRTGLDMDLGCMNMTMSDGTSLIEAGAVRTGNTVETTLSTSGRDIVYTRDFQGEYLPAFVDLAAAAMEWNPGDERVFPTFDPSTGMLFEATVSCEALENMSLMGDTVEAARLLISQQGMRNTVWVHQGQIVREEEAGMGMVLTRVSPSTENNIIPSSDLYEVYAVTSNDVSSPRQTGERTWRMMGDIDWSDFQLDYPGLQSVSDDMVITVSALPPLDPIGYPFDAADETLHPFLQAEAMIQSDDPAVKALADSLTAGLANSWDAVMSISGYVDKAVENVPTVSLPSAVDVLDNLRGDCNEHTILAVALCRAAGIPAVTCAGVVYVDNGIFRYHAWPAVWVGEWVAIDPTLSQPVADATHIILAQGSLEAQYVVNAVLGRLQIEEYTGQNVSLLDEDDTLQDMSSSAAPLVVNSNSHIASVLQSTFPNGIELNHVFYPLEQLHCVPEDICNFSFDSEVTGGNYSALQVSGEVITEAIPAPLEAYSDDEYMLILAAFLIDRNGRVIWTQNGYPQDDGWVSVSGERCNFMLISSFDGELAGNRLVVIAAADPIRIPDSFETILVLGISEVSF